MIAEYFKDYDFANFWHDSEYAKKQYIEEKLSDEIVKSIENELGYKFPESYITLMKLHNGGIPTKTCYPTKTRTLWADDHIAITGIMGIGRQKTSPSSPTPGKNVKTLCEKKSEWKSIINSL